MAVLSSYLYKEVVPFVLMVTFECINVGTNTLFKAATDKGMSFYVYVVYSYAISSFLLLPFPLFFRNSAVLPPLSFSIIAKLSLLGLIAGSGTLMAYKGIENGSPILASAMSNVIPAFTFVLAIVFRMEKLAIKRGSSQAKMMGTIVSIGGAFIVIFYKGPSIINLSSTISSISHTNFLLSSDSKWIVGGFLLAADYFLTPIRYIFQTHILKEYPAELVVSFFYSFFACIFAGAISSIAEPNRDAWIPKFDISLVSMIYCGVLGTCFLNCLHSWILLHKGPFYVAMFRPLAIVIAAVMGVLFLGETLYVGRAIGAVVITIGFYGVMWGKSREQDYEDFRPEELESSPERISLLAGSKIEDI